MTKNEKAEARESNGLNTEENQPTMKINSNGESISMQNHTPTRNNFQFNSRRELLDATKLSRLPERKPFTMPDSPVSNAAASGCLACGGRLDADDTIQQSVKVCRKCLTQYAVIDGAIDAASKRKRREMLEKFAAEVQR